MSKLNLLVTMVLLGLTLSACQKEGPAEKAGKEIDKAFKRRSSGGQSGGFCQGSDQIEVRPSGQLVKTALRKLKPKPHCNPTSIWLCNGRGMPA